MHTPAFGPDGRLYLTVGDDTLYSEPDGRHATILASADAAVTWKSFVCGVREALGFDWHPDTGQMWGVDGTAQENGGQARLGPLAVESAPTRLICYALGKTAPSGAADAPISEVAVPGFPAGSVPVGIAFYTGKQFPIDYHGDAFVTLHGSIGRRPAGFKVVRVRFRAGKPARVEDFLTGFVAGNGTREFGRPTGIAVAYDASLLVTDDENGVIYRIAYCSDDLRQTPLFGKELH